MPVVSSISPELNARALKACYELKNSNTPKFQLLADEYYSEVIDSLGLQNLTPKHDFPLAIQINPSFMRYGKKQFGNIIDPADCINGIKAQLNKIIFGNEKGFSSMDFSTSTRDPNDAIPFLTLRLQAVENHIKSTIQRKIAQGIIKRSDSPAELKKYLTMNNEAFAKRFDWTYEEGNWENFKP